MFPNVVDHFSSLAHLWTEWHQEYLAAGFPRVVIRYEDMVFHPQKVMRTLTDCVGLSLKKPFQINVEASKQHGMSAGRKEAMANVVQRKAHFAGMMEKDLEIARVGLDQKLITSLHYPTIPDDSILPEAPKVFQTCYGNLNYNPKK
jgi:hypothetical protein